MTNQIDPATVFVSQPERERRTKRIVGLVTPSTLEDWHKIQKSRNISAGDLVTWAVKSLGNDPELVELLELLKDYPELPELLELLELLKEKI